MISTNQEPARRPDSGLSYVPPAWLAVAMALSLYGLVSSWRLIGDFGLIAVPDAKSLTADGRQVIVAVKRSNGTTVEEIVDANTGLRVRPLPTGGYVWATADQLLTTTGYPLDGQPGQKVVTTDLSGTPTSAILLPSFVNSDYSIYLTPY